MLILTRKAGGAIFMGDDIEITIFGVTESNVRIGIDAPNDVSAHREEIYKRIQDESR